MLNTYVNILNSEWDSQGGRHVSRRLTDKSGCDILKSLASGSHVLSVFVFFSKYSGIHSFRGNFFKKCNSNKVISLKYILNVHY